MMNQYGFKVKYCGIIMHHMIPLMNDLKIAGGTNVETVSFNNAPYLEIYKDSTNIVSSVKVNKDPQTVKLDEWLYNPLQVALADSVNDFEFPLNNFGTMETLKVGERKAFTIKGSDLWFKGNIPNNKLAYVPTFGGNVTYDKPDEGPLIYSPNHPHVFKPVFVRMVPVKGNVIAVLNHHPRSIKLHAKHIVA
ncbi:uncharacterized protein [Palaemon carinicauda]|uniref:uncharacterized protein n=1 Tax=Palaemon carinicauda TaxID=392227 RepID=UPI0035B608A1